MSIPNWKRILIKTFIYENTTFNIYNIGKLQNITICDVGVVRALKDAKCIILGAIFE